MKAGLIPHEMESPFSDGLAILEGVRVVHEFRRESFEIFEQRYRCQETGHVFYTPVLDQLNLAQVHNQYRSRNQIPFPKEIRAIRELAGLPASKMSEILGFGVNGYRQYEQGEMPTQAHAKLIQLAANPERLSEFVEARAWIFSPNQLQRIRARLQQRQHSGNLLSPVLNYLWRLHAEPDEFTGFVKPDFQKLAHFVLFFVEKAKPLKTRLNKLLFYADFLHFKETGFSISGTAYRAIPFGPVPAHFHELFGLLESEGYVKIEEKDFPNGHIGELFEPAKTVDPSLFDETEWAVMNRVLESLSDVRTRDLIEKSHQEAGWQANQQTRDLISYQAFGFSLIGPEGR